jgi:uncharacterized tellurite resistance protein B-like protein
MEMEQTKALAYFQNLYIVAAADQQLSREEANFLVEVAQIMGISAEQSTRIMTQRDSLEFVIPETDEERNTQLEDIITMMIIDRKIHEKEYNLCLKFAEKIGYDRKAFEEVMFRVVRGN